MFEAASVSSRNRTALELDVDAVAVAVAFESERFVEGVGGSRRRFEDSVNL
jgi:hypothetical protein